MANLIGVTGKAGAGKDELARILRERHGFTRMAFADPLKEAAAVAFDINENMFHTPEGKQAKDDFWSLTNREILQRFGEAMCKEFGEDFWVQRWFIDYPGGEDESLVITDVRKDVEASMIRDLGGVVVQINRECAGLQGGEANHVSERGVSQALIDWTITNDGSLDDLADEVNKLLVWDRCRGRG